MRCRISLFVLGLPLLTSSQSPSDLPQCAQSCLGGSNAFPSSCSQTDISCICKNASFIGGVSCCVYSACPESDISSAINYASKLCAGVDVTVPTTSPTTCSASLATGDPSPQATSNAAVMTTSSSAGGTIPSSTSTKSSQTPTSTAAVSTKAAVGSAERSGHDLRRNGVALAGAVAAVMLA